MTGVWAIAVAVVLIVLSAFFVAVEFALITARRHRLADAATSGSSSARAALRASRELSLVLAGAQLGITLCTLGLGAVAKPAIHDALLPVFAGWGLPEAASDVAAFVLALAVVTLLHLVVGEMAPKSWAIAHPERSAILLARPMRGFIALTRPLLTALNGAANRCLRAFGVEAVDELTAGHNPATLRQLVDHSAEAGALDHDRHDRLVVAMELHGATLRQLARPLDSVFSVRAGDRVQEIRDTARRGGHLRLLVWPDTGPGSEPLGLVHVRDTLAADDATTAAELLRPVLVLAADTTVYPALTTMRVRRIQFALVRDDTGLAGLVTMQDLLDRLLPAETPA